MSLLDSVVEQSVKCKVPGCKNTWTLASEEIVENWKHNNHKQPKRMCRDCKSTLKALDSIEVRCSSKVCENTLEISTYQQLVLHKKGRALNNQTFFCETCQHSLKEIKDKEVPCRMKGCKKTWTWYASSQLKQGGDPAVQHPPPRLCNSCFRSLQKLEPKKQPCRVQHCPNEWELDRMSQLEMQLNHKKVHKRMCSSCNSTLKELKPSEQLCQVEDCNGTWTWLPYTQLEYHVLQTKDPSVSPPQRYCSSCFSLKKRIKPISLHCKKGGCPNPIEYPMEQQLLDAVNHKSAPHHVHYCQTCEDFQSALTAQEVPCHQEHCDRSWHWSAEAQFETSHYQHKVLTAGRPPIHYCDRCHDFLTNRADEYVNCQQCEEQILWTSRQQLMTDLGVWVAPKLCPNCLKNS